MSALSSATSTVAGTAGPDAVAASSGALTSASAASPCPVGSQRRASCTYGAAVVDTAVEPATSDSASAGRWAVPNGTRMVKRVPLPSALSAVMLPPCRPTSSCTRASPMPLPSLEREREFSMRWKRSNSRGISSGGTPTPVSATVTTASRPSARTATRIEPSKVNFSALLSRLRTTFSHMPWSRCTGSGSGGQSTSKSSPALSTAERNTLASSAVTAARSTGS